MTVHPPRRQQLLPLSPEERARREAEAEAWRAERARKEAEARPAKVAALRAGPALRDSDKAADCHCGCHPRPAQVELHDGGPSCPCQKTPEELRQARKGWLARVAELRLDFGVEEGRRALAQRAKALGVTAEWTLIAAPLVITGTIDGRGFYLRERHGQYRVTVASDEDPGADPWNLPPEKLTLDIAEGDESDLLDADGRPDPAQALTVAVDAARTFLSRRTCAHEPPRDAGHEFCSHCGVRLSEAAQWSP